MNMDVLSLYKPALYPVHKKNESTESSPLVESLADLCCRSIVTDSSTTQNAVKEVPSELCYNLMKAALLLNRDRAVEVLVSSWPYAVLALHKFAPPLLDQTRLQYGDCHAISAMTTGMKYTTCLAHTFVECLKKRSPMQLKCLDLSGYPVAEVIVNYLASHVLLAYNEQKQNEIITQYNRLTEDMPQDQRHRYDLTTIMPSHNYLVLLDMRLESRDAHMEACRALKVSNNPNCRFTLRPSLLDINSLGVARICVLLDLLPTDCLQSLGLQFNSIKEEGLQLLAPYLQKFTKLTALDLSYNCFNITGSTQICQDLCKTFQCLPNLMRLDLASNRMKRKFRTVLSSITSPLEFLNVTFCGMSEEDLEYLEKSNLCSSLQEFYLCDNDISEDKVEIFLRVLQALSGSLRVLDMSSCNMTESDLLSLLLRMPVMSRLQFLSIHKQREQLNCANLLSALERLSCMSTLQLVRASVPAEVLASVESDNDTDDREQLLVAKRRHFVQHISSCISAFCQRKNREPFQIIVLE